MSAQEGWGWGGLSGLSRFRRGGSVSHLPRSDKLAPLDHQGDGFGTRNSQQKQSLFDFSSCKRRDLRLIRRFESNNSSFVVLVPFMANFHRPQRGLSIVPSASTAAHCTRQHLLSDPVSYDEFNNASWTVKCGSGVLLCVLSGPGTGHNALHQPRTPEGSYCRILRSRSIRNLDCILGLSCINPQKLSAFWFVLIFPSLVVCVTDSSGRDKLFSTRTRLEEPQRGQILLSRGPN